MKFSDIDLDTGTYVSKDGLVVDAMSSVYMIEWDSCEPSYVEIFALASASKTCPCCSSLVIRGVSILTNDGEIYSCSICKKISRVVVGCEVLF
jgi:hypothetical protein